MSQLAPLDLAGYLPESPTSAWLETHPKLGVDFMDHLFNRLGDKYPRLWRQSFNGPAAIRSWKETWAETFVREGITPADVKVGLANVAAQYPDFPPTEGQFLLCCRPPLDYESAHAEAVKQLHLRESFGDDKWSHPAIYWAAVAVGSFDLRNLPWDRVKGRWKTELDKAFANRPYVDVPEFCPALPAPGKTLDRDEARAQLDLIKSKLGRVGGTLDRLYVNREVRDGE